ncbi:MAG: AAA family ATPase [Candidatus Omnitrophota bacterium]
MSTRQKEKRIFLAATRQNDGKTMVGIGLLAYFKETIGEVGFIKPVGQKYLEVNGEKIDKDAILASRILGIGNDLLKKMNPITVEREFTREYLDRRYRLKDLINAIKSSYAKCAKGKEVVIIEGTGHAGVGSVFDLNNAVVARILGASVVLITAGGIGKAIDEIMLNKALFDREGVKLAGVIINKVDPEKKEELEKYLRIGLGRKGITLLGMIPYTEPLSTSTMGQIKDGLGLALLSGARCLNQKVRGKVVGAMFPHNALQYIKNGSLLITSGDREDLILTALSLVMTKKADEPHISGLILTGGIRPHKTIVELIRNTPIPVLVSRENTYTVASRVHDLIVKIREDDCQKIEIARKLVKEHVNVDKILVP